MVTFFDFSNMGTIPKALLALGVCIILTTVFAMIAGFFMARFKMHPFISTMANMLIIFGLVTYATREFLLEQLIGNSEYLYSKGRKIPNDYFMGNHRSSCCMVHLEQDNIWKNLYAVGGNPEAATVSGISVFK